jgi:hypothetical protein
MPAMAPPDIPLFSAGCVGGDEDEELGADVPIVIEVADVDDDELADAVALEVEDDADEDMELWLNLAASVKPSFVAQQAFVGPQHHFSLVGVSSQGVICTLPFLPVCTTC